MLGVEVRFIRVFLKQNREKQNIHFLFFHNKGSLIDFGGVIVFAIILMAFLISFSKIVMDLPYMLKQDFSSVTGVVVGQNASGRDDVYEDRGFELQDLKTGEILTLQVNYTPIRKGEYYEVLYLPHTKIGTIVRKLRKDEIETWLEKVSEKSPGKISKNLPGGPGSLSLPVSCFPSLRWAARSR